MKRYTGIFLLCGFLTPVVFGGAFSSSGKGTSTAGFLKIGAGARAVGLGEAFTTVADDATALYWNPAALRQVENNSMALMHAAYLESARFDYGAFAHSGEKVSIGVGVQYLSFGELTGRDQNKIETGGFEPSDMAVSVGSAWDLKGFSLGVSGKYIQSKIQKTAETGAVDLGLLSPRILGEKLRVGFAAFNLGGRMKFDQKSESLPVLVKAGSHYQIYPHWLGALDLGFPKDNKPYVGTGTEYKLIVGNALSLSGRVGYNSRSASDVDGFSGLSLGGGVGFKTINLDYGFVPFGDLGDTHRVSLSLVF